MNNQENANAIINSTALQKSKDDLNSIGLGSAQKEAESMRVAMATAKYFPRDMSSVEDKIYKNCQRTRFAENAEFCFPRGGKDIKGATIKLVESVAQCYGNIQSDIKELKRYSDYSECEAFAWDMENNVKVSRSFNVPHSRDTKSGKVKLTDDRDIREMIFNYGSRNLRACLERVIPRDLVEQALDWCKSTLKSDIRPLGDRIAACKDKFKELEVDATFLEKLIGEKSDKWTNSHLKTLVGYYSALKDGDTTIAELSKNFTEKLSKAQITELAKIIGKDEMKITLLKDNGYEMSEIKNISKSDFEAVKALFNETKKEQIKQEEKPAEETKETK